jgi:hydrogenase expression/formation protein HypD
VFAAVGFETTAPASAAAVREAAKRGLDNFSVLTSHKLIIPAMRALLEGGQVRLDGFMLPGHVSVIIGSQPYERIAEQHKLPCVVAGFEAVQMAAAMAQLATMARDQAHGVVNAYAQAVQAEGNPIAQQILEEVFEPADTPWRALGVIPQSGLVLRPAFEKFDAQRRFNLTRPADRNPPGCLCGKVITGMASPHDCELFATQCTPIHPIGPCMVSSEGTCQAWFKYHRNRPAPPIAKPQPSSTPA